MRSILGLASAATLLAALSTGCNLYFGGDDEPPCYEPAHREEDGKLAPAVQRRNPYTGDCYTGGGGGGGGCGDRPAAADAIWFDDRWPVCENDCNSLDEAACAKADACRAIYVDPCPPGTDCEALPHFAVCWPTASDGPVRGGDCSAITDAFECSRHDDCSATHEPRYCPAGADCSYDDVGNFIACQPEGTTPVDICAGDQDCAPDETCNLTDYCYADPDCPHGAPCPPVCFGKCEPKSPPPPPPPPACAGLPEPTCIDMIDGCLDWYGQQVCTMSKCVPIYEGQDCTCGPAGCTCSTWTYQSCGDGL
jgi:hypothetical protein